MRKFLYLLMAAIMMIGVGAAQAAEPAKNDGRIVIDMSNLPPELANQVKDQINASVSKAVAEAAAQASSQVAKAAQDAAKAAKDAVPNKGDLHDYAEIGVQIGQALGEAAKSVGIAVNEFASTKVGVLATALIVYKIIGHEAVGVISGVAHFFIGLALFLIGFRVWWIIFNRMCIIKETIEEVGQDGKKTTRHVFYNLEKMDSDSRDQMAGYRIIGVVGLFVWLGVCCMVGL
jgi:hypothetical protein